MILNVDLTDMIRQLLIANPYLAQRKGSLKSVRMLMNMLGFKCRVCVGDELIYLIEFAESDVKYSEVFGSADTIFQTSDKQPDQSFIIYKPTNVWFSCDTDDVKDSVQNLSENSIVKLRFNPDLTKNEKKSVIDCMPAFEACINTAKENGLTFVSDTFIGSGGDNRNIYIIVTNVIDEELKPVKAILARQLREILPINMIIDEKNIIGGCSVA